MSEEKPDRFWDKVGYATQTRRSDRYWNVQRAHIMSRAGSQQPVVRPWILAPALAAVALGIYIHGIDPFKDAPTYLAHRTAEARAWDARITEVAGRVTVFSEGEEEGVEAVVEVPLQEGDHIETGADGRVELALAADSVMELGPKSALSMSTLNEEDSRLQLRVGVLVAKLRFRLMKVRKRLEVETPTAVAAVRGTEFAVAVAEDGETDVGVFDEGKVAVKAKEDASVEETIVEAHQEVSVPRKAKLKAKERQGRKFLEVKKLKRLATHRKRVKRILKRQEKLKKTWKRRKAAHRREMRREIRRKHREHIKKLPQEKRKEFRRHLRRRHHAIAPKPGPERGPKGAPGERRGKGFKKRPARGKRPDRDGPRGPHPDEIQDRGPRGPHPDEIQDRGRDPGPEGAERREKRKQKRKEPRRERREHRPDERGPDRSGPDDRMDRERRRPRPRKEPRDKMDRKRREHRPDKRGPDHRGPDDRMDRKRHRPGEPGKRPGRREKRGGDHKRPGDRMDRKRAPNPGARRGGERRRPEKARPARGKRGEHRGL